MLTWLRRLSLGLLIRPVERGLHVQGHLLSWLILLWLYLNSTTNDGIASSYRIAVLHLRRRWRHHWITVGLLLACIMLIDDVLHVFLDLVFRGLVREGLSHDVDVGWLPIGLRSVVESASPVTFHTAKALHRSVSLHLSCLLLYLQP